MFIEKSNDIDIPKIKNEFYSEATLQEVVNSLSTKLSFCLHNSQYGMYFTQFNENLKLIIFIKILFWVNISAKVT